MKSGYARLAATVMAGALIAFAGIWASYFSKPHVIMIVIDALRADHLSCYGYVRQTSPHIDAFARESTLFTNAYVSAPWTAPSVMGLYRGLYPHQSLNQGRKDQFILPDMVTLPVVFKRLGYWTVDTNSNYWLKPGWHGFEQGFDVYHTDLHWGTPDRAEQLLKPIQAWRFRLLPRPLFYLMHPTDVHAPYAPPPPYHGMFRGDPYSLPPDPVPLLPDNNWALLGGMMPSLQINGINDLSYYKDEYDACIRFEDSVVGQILDWLRARRLYDTSWIIITADHGECLGEHKLICGHGLEYDENIRVPLLIKPPGRRREQVVNRLVQNVDLLPTLCEALGAAVPPCSGVSFLPLLEDPQRSGREYIFGEGGMFGRKYVRSRRWKLIQGAAMPADATDPANLRYRTELFDLEHDPHEEKNVLADQPEVFQALTKVLAEWSKDEVRPSDYKPADFIPDDPQMREELAAHGYFK